MFLNRVHESGDRTALLYQDHQKKISKWSYNDYYKNAMLFAKALHKLGVSARSSVAIMGFNSPQWFFAFIGTVMYNNVATGIYATNSSDACLY